MLKTADGDSWYGDGPSRNAYRLKKTKKNRTVPMDEVDSLVLGQIVQDMTSPDFIKALFRESKKFQETKLVDPAKNIKRDLIAIDKEIAQTVKFGRKLADPTPALREVDKLEVQRKALADEIERLKQEHSANAVLANITEEQIGHMLSVISEDMKEMDKEVMKDQIASIVEKIVLDPESLELTIHYKIPVKTRNRMASPGGVEPPLPA